MPVARGGGASGAGGGGLSNGGVVQYGGIRQSPLANPISRIELREGGAGPIASSSVTWNSADKAATFTLSNGDLTATKLVSSGTFGAVRGTVGKATGKWYFEVKQDLSPQNASVGVANLSASLTAYIGSDTNGIGYYDSAFVGYGGSNVGAGFTTQAQFDVIGCAFDADADLVWFSKNGTWQNGSDPAAGTGGLSTPGIGTFYPTFCEQNAGSAGTARFLAASFTYTAPTGFQALEDAGAGAVTGTAAVSEANDTVSASGSVDVSGSVTRTEANDTAAGTGASTVTGTVTRTEANDTTALSGSVSVTGTISRTEASDTASGTGSVSVSGSGASTEANDSASLSGSVVVSGSLARTEASDTLSASGSVGSSAITGTASLTEANDSVAIVAAALVAGSMSISEIADIASGAGTATQPDVILPAGPPRPRRRRLKIVDYGMILTRPERR